MNVEMVWKEYSASLKVFLHANVSNPDDVDDLLQDILIKTYHNLGDVKETAKIKSWLFQVANHSINNSLNVSYLLFKRYPQMKPIC